MIQDLRGRSFRFARPPQRVVSLVPSLTETLFELGAGDQVVGATQFCIFPDPLPCPRLGGTKNPDIDAIRALKPDLVHMNLEENLKRHAEAIELFAPVFVTEPKSVEDVGALFDVLGRLHRREQAALTLREQLRGAVDDLRGSVPFRFACAIWKKPWMWCGGDTYVSSLIRQAGGINVLAAHDRYPQLSLEQVTRLDPQVIFLPDEPYLFREDDAREVRRASSALVTGPFPGHLFTWHGVRTIEGLRFLKRWKAETAAAISAPGSH